MSHVTRYAQLIGARHTGAVSHVYSGRMAGGARDGSWQN
jgi:hypothetical protein